MLDESVGLAQFETGSMHGALLDCKDTHGKWLSAVVTMTEESRVLVHYTRYNRKWDEWIPKNSDRLAKFGSKADKKTLPPSYDPKNFARPEHISSSGPSSTRFDLPKGTRVTDKPRIPDAVKATFEKDVTAGQVKGLARLLVMEGMEHSETRRRNMGPCAGQLSDVRMAHGKWHKVEGGGRHPNTPLAAQRAHKHTQHHITHPCRRSCYPKRKAF